MVKEFAQSAANALRGIRFVWQRERNFRIQGTLALMLLPVCALLGFSLQEWIWVLIAMATVLTAEMINTIVEEVLDVVEPHYSVHVGRLKDITAGIVLFLSLFAILLGFLTVLHHVTAP